MTKGITTQSIVAKGVTMQGIMAADGRGRGLLLDILLVCINGIGIVGALLESLGVEWRGDLNLSLLWGGVLIICALAVLWWQGKKKSYIALRTAALCLVYAAGLIRLWTAVISPLWQSLQSEMEGYGTLTLEYVGELLRMAIEGSRNPEDIRTLGFLAALLLPALLTGFLCIHGKWQIFLAENIMWIAVACYTNLFPGTPFLILCVVGIALGMARGEFRDDMKVWSQAAAGMLGLALLGVWLSGGLFVPALNGQYERITGLRHSFYVTVNHRLIPGLQDLINDYGVGRGVDVTGALGRKRFSNHTSAGIYQVTLDEMPWQTLYLRGFVGADYKYRQWEPEDEAALEGYYQEKGFILSSNVADYLNINYRAMEARGRQGHVRIEELTGKGSYSLLPYGALVTDSFSAHSGGFVDRQGSSYDFQYRQLSGAAQGALPSRWENVERQYRQYVYDNFLDYPGERLPRLTEALEQADLPKGDPYRCAEAVISFLEEHAHYRLDTPAPPLGKDFVEYCLFESHEGYCAHFASAAVLMFRYCGVPARYATGYSASAQRFVEAGDKLYSAVLTGAQAHAWAEVYVDGVGWVPVETTPGAAAFAEDNRMEMLARLGVLTGDVELTRGELSAGEEDEEEDEEEDDKVLSGIISELEDLEDEDEEEEEDADKWSVSLAGIVWTTLLVIALAGIAAVGTAFFRRWDWKKKLQKTEGQEKIFLLYRNMRNALQVMGCSKKLLLTGEAFWDRLQTVLPTQEKKEYDRICDIMEQSSFGNRAPTQEELTTLNSLHDEMLRKLYLKAPSYKRPAFRGLMCCMPPSLHLARK